MNKRIIYAVSYPGSGLTWLHMMLGKAIDLHFGMGWGNSKALLEGRYWLYIDVPEIVFDHPDRPYLKAVNEYRKQLEPKYKNAKVIFLARDPRDIIVSMFFKFSRRWEVINVPRFAGTLSKFMRHEKYGIKGIVAYYNLWAKWRDELESFQFMRYEDIRQYPELELDWFLRMLPLVITPETIHQAVKFASFDNMWKLESKNYNKWLREVKKGDPESRRVRRGKVGGYVDYMCPTILPSSMRR